jgi:hypothetical protein
LPPQPDRRHSEYDRRKADIQLRLRSGRYVPDTVNREVERANEGTHVQKAAQICLRGILSAGAAQAWEFTNAATDADRKTGYFAANKILKPVEEAALREWVREEGLMLDDAQFERRWEDGGSREGTEHQVYFDTATQRWFKRNNLCNHGHWLEYFQRLQLQNWLFPDAPVRLEGFVEHEGELQPVVSQDDVQADPEVVWDEESARKTTRAYMEERGFQPITDPARKDDYVRHGVEVNDLHNENVVMTRAGVIAFDPVPRLDWKSKLDRVRARLGEEPR